MPKALRWIIVITFLIFFVIIFAYVSLTLANIYDTQNRDVITKLLEQIQYIASAAWSFIQPFMQLIVVLVIIDWLLNKWGISFQSKANSFHWNIQTIIGIVIIGSFCIAALGGITTGIGALKDLALVVVGFYFGSQKKTVDFEKDGEKTIITEEHENGISDNNLRK